MWGEAGGFPPHSFSSPGKCQLWSASLLSIRASIIWLVLCCCYTVIIIYLAFSQLYWGRLPVKPDLAEYQYFTRSCCLPDLHNPLTGVTRYFMARLESDFYWLLTIRNDYQRSPNDSRDQRLNVLSEARRKLVMLRWSPIHRPT
ncbi:hypothetical protein PYW07_009397 [Mythimna separata]|uniref:Uncharacterized protein n=1 Tax=Mythimna separata TaxID=271217 RepID=A0AAD8DN60_MYTSE|nr:hypothetical protein PYW07_009397 [Mythimna separata]